MCYIVFQVSNAFHLNKSLYNVVELRDPFELFHFVSVMHCYAACLNICKRYSDYRA